MLAAAVTLVSLLALALACLTVFEFHTITLEQRLRHSHANVIGTSSLGFELNSLWILAFAGAVFGITFIAFWHRSSRLITTLQ
jgi:hypothetical protein